MTDGAVTVPPHPPAKCTCNDQRKCRSMTAHLLQVNGNGSPMTKKLKNTVPVHVLLRNHCVEADIDVTNWSDFAKRVQNWITGLRGTHRIWHVWSIVTRKRITFTEGRVNVVNLSI